MADAHETQNGTRKQQAIALRRQGMSYRDIESRVGVSRGTLSLWLRDVELSFEQTAALDPTGPAVISRRAQSNRATWARRRATVRARARNEVATLSAGELFVAGVVAYWAEGAKNKPWRNGEQVAFINSDPEMIRLFLRWLDLVGVDGSRLVFHVSIHESADSAAAVAFWANVVGVPADSFRKTTLKRNRPKTIRRNVNDDYHGCCIVRVSRSAELNLQIAGWFEGLTSGATNHG